MTFTRKDTQRYTTTGDLALSYRLQADEENEHMAVQTSVMSLVLDVEQQRPLLHYDFERDKPGYPESHLQVHASSEDWAAFSAQGDRGARALQKLHLPVGGRRARPTLEDVIEFVAREQLVDVAPDWQDVIAEHRQDFQRRQLKAGVRRDPDAAAGQLAEMGWTLERPEPA